MFGFLKHSIARICDAFGWDLWADYWRSSRVRR